LEIYRLTGRGEELAHAVRSPRTPEWAVIHYLNRQGVATKEQVLTYVPSASTMTLMKLRMRGLIIGGSSAGV
jgi:hypothetical protein